MRANASEDVRTRLGEDEVLAQMAHLTFAAQETTSGTISWILYELARHPEYQTRIREEVREARARVDERGDSDFTLEDLDGMKMMLAVIKVCCESQNFRCGVVYRACTHRKHCASIRSCITCGALLRRTT